MIFILTWFVQQWRLFPYLAAACVLKISVTSLTDVYLAIIEKSRANSNGFEELVCNVSFEFRPFNGILSQIMISILFPQTKEVSEVHALISSSKALLTWTARDAIQEAREACGGHVCIGFQ